MKDSAVVLIALAYFLGLVVGLVAGLNPILLPIVFFPSVPMGVILLFFFTDLVQKDLRGK